MPDVRKLTLWLVLLAAGASRRLGRPKQAVDIDGESLLHRSARIGLASCDGGLAVLGYEDQAMRPLIADLTIACVTNADWDAGMGGSIACGISALPEAADGALILPCDLPGLEGDELGRLAAAWRDNPEQPVAARYGSIIGAPAVFPRSAFAALETLEGDRGAAGLLRTLDPITVALPAAALDLDRPEDLEHLTRS